MIRHGLAVLLLMACIPCSAAERPHIILIVIEGVGRDWIHCYGGIQSTPCIDELASRGLRFQNAWVTPQRIPSEATIQTGLYPFRHGWIEDSIRETEHGINNDQLLPMILRKSGYQTIIAGKWSLPFVAEASTVFQHQTNDVSQNSIETILSKRDQHSPIFLLAQLGAPDPMQGNSGIADHFSRHVARVDRQVGDLVAVTDRLGMAKDTVIMLTSNHGSTIGGQLVAGSHFDESAQTVAIPAGHQACSDIGAHVPLIVAAPSLVEAGDTRDLVDASDFVPTILELANVQRPQGIPLDGRSFMASLKGNDDPFEKRNWIFSQFGSFAMVRDWHHILDSNGNFHDLDIDPLQRTKVNVLDKQAPHRRQRLAMILQRLQNDPAWVSLPNAN